MELAPSRGVNDPRTPSPADGRVKFLLDTNIFDELLVNELARDRLLSLVERGRVEVLTTLVQGDELMQMSDPSKRGR
jgi:hypothetical protein